DTHRLWLQNVLVIDGTSSAQSSGDESAHLATLPDKTITGKFSLVAGATYGLRLEYLHHGDSSARVVGGAGRVRVRLSWESRSIPLQTVPPSVLYPRGGEIIGSPWRYTVS
ncbi:unnamed protein product, partial [Sphacelaria rigidula]